MARRKSLVRLGASLGVLGTLACVAGCGASRSSNELGDVSAESAAVLPAGAPASLFTASNLTTALGKASAILPGSHVESVHLLPGKLFVTVNTANGRFATIVVAANDRVHAVLSDAPLTKGVEWSVVDAGAPAMLIASVVAKGSTLDAVTHVDAAVDDAGAMTWTVYVDGRIDHLEGDAHGSPIP